MGNFTNLSKTLYNYFNSFGVPAYLEYNIPVGATFPYISYTLSYEDGYIDNLIQARIWTKSSGLTQLATLADKIGDNIGNGITVNGADGGTVWIKKGSPFVQFVPDDDTTLKVAYLTLTTNILF